MADRYPLVVDNLTNTVKELPSGDNLNLNGSAIVNASVSGNITVTQSSSTTNAVTVDTNSINDTVVTGLGSVGINTSLPTAPLQINLPFQPNGSFLGPSILGLGTVGTTPGHHGAVAIAATVGPALWGATIHGTIGGGVGAVDGGGIEIGGGPSLISGSWISLAGATRGDGRANWFSLATGAAGNFKQRMVINGSGDTYIGPGGIGATSILVDNSTGSVAIGTSAVPSYLMGTPSSQAKLKVVGLSTFTDTVAFGNDWFINGGSDGIFGAYYYPGGGATTLAGLDQWLTVKAAAGIGTATRLNAPGYIGGPYIECGIAGVTVSGALNVTGALSKGSGSFRIPHPVAEGKDLVHSFIEGPRADLIYRGTVTLSAGAATVNLDQEYGLTAGTWAALCRNPQVWVTSDTGWTLCKGSVADGVLTIEAKTSTCTETVSWLVVAERQDAHMYNTEWTDENGRPILEPNTVIDPYVNILGENHIS